MCGSILVFFYNSAIKVGRPTALGGQSVAVSPMFPGIKPAAGVNAAEAGKFRLLRNVIWYGLLGVCRVVLGYRLQVNWPLQCCWLKRRAAALLWPKRRLKIGYMSGVFHITLRITTSR